jgi:hypothetical protein
MGTPMYASAPTADGRWYAVRIRPNGQIGGVIPGLFDSKTAADANAKCEVGLPR